MTTSVCVLGVLGLCWDCLDNPTQLERPESLVCTPGVLGVLGLSTHARACAIFCSADTERKNLYARTNKPNKPNTLNTPLFNCLILLGFICVEYVLSRRNVCWVLILGGAR